MKHIPNKQALGAAHDLEAFGFQPDDPGVDPDGDVAVDDFDLGWLTLLLIGAGAVCAVSIFGIKAAFGGV